ncbi:hypothetical protein FB45DRAFT_920017 [Roridomyces roridus]|uniref:Uncharacterized protein n=1 Tax=Roridomyces roridus TaxID=1738132 RepID=A0AAD7BS90_9AGAR|nr:hypothetical protein FB45DRAFT_920017 [Roridomyces roridus]
MNLSKLLAALLPTFARRGEDSGPIDWVSLHCPEANSTAGLPTPTYGSTGLVFTVCSELNISAPLSDVYNAIIDFQSYPTWNTFVFAVDLPGNVTSTPADVFIGMPMTFHTAGVIPLSNTTSNEIITVLDPATTGPDAGGYSMSAWRFDDGLGGVGIRAEHPNVLVDVGGGVTRYLSFESYYGLGTALILPLEGNLQAAFEKQGADLKAFLERG